MRGHRNVGRRDLVSMQHELDDDQVVALPGPGGFWLAVRGDRDTAVHRLLAIPAATATAAAAEPHFMVGHRHQARALASEWSEETNQLIVRCWPGPLTVILPAPDDLSSTGTVRVTMAASRPLRRLCQVSGPWRVRPPDAPGAPDALSQMVLVFGDTSHEGPGPTLVDCTMSPARVLREGALPALFIQAAQIMGGRRRFRLGGRPDVPGSPQPG